MRTTIKIDDQLLAEAKARAAASGRTLGAVVEDALREVLARRPSRGHDRGAELPTFAGGRLLPGVDLDHSVRSTGLSATVLLRRWRRLPVVDAEGLRADLDDLVDPSI